MGLNFRAPNMQIHVKQAVGMCKFCKQRATNTFVNLDLFHSYHDYFLQNYTIKSMKCQHNPCQESIKTSIIGRKLGKFQIGKFWSIIYRLKPNPSYVYSYRIKTQLATQLQGSWENITPPKL